MLTIIGIIAYFWVLNQMSEEDRNQTIVMTIVLAVLLGGFRAAAAVERPVFKGYAPKLYILQPCDYKKDKTCDPRDFKLVESAASRLLYKLRQQPTKKGK